MCIGDLILGQNIVSITSLFTTVAGAFSVAVEPNSNRVGVILSQSNTTNTFIHPTTTISFTGGIYMDNIRSPLVLLSTSYGDFVTKRLSVFSAGVVDIFIVELIIPPEVARRFDPQKTLNV